MEQGVADGNWDDCRTGYGWRVGRVTGSQEAELPTDEALLRAGRNLVSRLLEGFPTDFPPAVEWMSQVDARVGRDT